MRVVSICVLAVLIGIGAAAQSNGQDPVLTPRNQDNHAANPASQPPASNSGQLNEASPNTIPEGARFIIKLKDTLDTKNLEQGKHFKAELREDLVTPSGLTIPKGRTIKGHIGSFEHGYSGARMQIALDEIETR